MGNLLEQMFTQECALDVYADHSCDVCAVSGSIIPTTIFGNVMCSFTVDSRKVTLRNPICGLPSLRVVFNWV